MSMFLRKKIRKKGDVDVIDNRGLRRIARMGANEECIVRSTEYTA
jgi:hypothetical protein